LILRFRHHDCSFRSRWQSRRVLCTERDRSRFRERSECAYKRSK